MSADNIPKEKMLACPFCGSSRLTMRHFFVECGNCAALGPNGNSESQATEKWNKRHSFEPRGYRTASEFERLYAALDDYRDGIIKSRIAPTIRTDEATAAARLAIIALFGANQPHETKSAEPKAPQSVWIVENRTTAIVFANESAAQRYVASFPGSISGGLAIVRTEVIGGEEYLGRQHSETKEGWVESKSLAGISFPTMMPSETNKLPTPDEGNGETVGRAIAETTRNASNTEAQRSTILPCGCDTERSPRWMRIGCGCLPKSENG